MADEPKVFRGEHGDELIVVSSAPPENAPGRIWIQPFSYARYEEAYQDAMRETLARWEEARLKTTIGQYERLTDEFAGVMRQFGKRLQPIVDEVGAQLRDLFELLADAAHKANEKLADDGDEGGEP